jgi:hypothetical protein
MGTGNGQRTIHQHIASNGQSIDVMTFGLIQVVKSHEVSAKSFITQMIIAIHCCTNAIVELAKNS